MILTEQGEHKTLIPGRGGFRVPLPRVIEISGRWGYAIGSSRPPSGGSHHLMNFIRWPDLFECREAPPKFSDMRSLMERNSSDNRDDVGEFQCWSELWGRHSGETLVIASCGPSLTESLPELYKHRDKFKLLCLNRSHRAFMDPDVKPDYYYFVERRGLPDWVHEIEDGTGRVTGDLDLSGVIMIGTPQCDTRVVRAFDKDKRYWGWSSLGALRDPDVRALKSFDVKAATTIGNAPYIAKMLGFERIILVGCDFSLDTVVEENDADDSQRVMPRRMYFDRMWDKCHQASDPSWLSKFMTFVGHDGKACQADAQLLGYCDFFRAVLDIIQYEGGIECINASPRGILEWNNQRLEDIFKEI